VVCRSRGFVDGVIRGSGRGNKIKAFGVED
jgi:hypothetical protein